MIALVLVVVAAGGGDADFVRAYDAVAPGLGERFQQGTDALEAERLDEAAAKFEGLIRDAPALSISRRRLAQVRSQQGRHADAVALLERAQAAEASPENDVALAQALLARNQTGDEQRAFLLLNRVLNSSPEGSSPWISAKHAECVRLGYANQRREFESCARALEAAAPTDPSVRVFASQVAMIDGDLELARKRLEEARPDLSPAAYERLSRRLDDAVPARTRYGAKLLWATAVWLAVLVVMAVLGSVLSALTLHTARTLATTREPHASSGAAALRALYRGVLRLGAVFFYASLPFIAVVVIGLFGGLLSLGAGRMPTKLLVLLIIGGGATLLALVRSLFVRVSDDDDPGLRLELSRLPRLKALLDSVASRVGTRPVDAVFLSPGTELEVFERGPLMQRLRGRGERCLVLGRGLLEGFEVGGFRSVLAHEFGHFSHEDTAGGDVALMTRRSLQRLGSALAESGTGTWYNPAWWFFRLYRQVFLRISQGASRLQEVLADRVAVFAFGSAAFAQGYRHVVEQSVRFEAHARRVVQQCVERKQPLVNVYRFVPESKPTEAAIAQELDAHLNREPDALDSHPSARERLTWAATLAVQSPPESGDRELVLSLFDDLEAVERQVTGLMRQSLLMSRDLMLAGE
ncbi:MAG: M48 family metalloprotease [Myxococcota bacterium]